jgi:hypothetical protein
MYLILLDVGLFVAAYLKNLDAASPSQWVVFGQKNGSHFGALGVDVNVDELRAAEPVYWNPFNSRFLVEYCFENGYLIIYK